jgi:hypothetical protein
VRSFIILASPRSRTAWLSTWLSDGHRTCWHDLLACVSDTATLRDIVNSHNGTIETAGGDFYRTLFDTFPNSRFAILRRSEMQIAQSLQRKGAPISQAHRALSSLAEAEGWLKNRTDVLTIDFEALNQEHVLENIWKTLRGDAHDMLRTRRLMKMRIEKVVPFWSGVAPSISDHEAVLRQMVK